MAKMKKLPNIKVDAETLKIEAYINENINYNVNSQLSTLETEMRQPARNLLYNSGGVRTISLRY